MSAVVTLDEETLRRAKADVARTTDVVYVLTKDREYVRDEAGRFAETGGGGGGTSISSGGPETGGGGGKSPTTNPSDQQYHNAADGKYHVKGDVEAAVRLIGEGQDVVLEQPREVSTLIDRLAAIGKSGDKKVYDLCRVSVSGTNLFCAESAGYKRVDMPQLSGPATPGSTADTTLPKDSKGGVDATPKFIESLTAQGHKVTPTTEDAGYLRATQRELDGAKVAGMMKAMQEGKISDEALVVSKDNYIIDGHHRWAAKVALGYSAQVTMDMPIIRVDIGVVPLVEEAKKFANQIGIPQRGVGKSIRSSCGCGDPCDCRPHRVVRLDADTLRRTIRPGAVYTEGSKKNSSVRLDADTVRRATRHGVVYAIPKYDPNQPRDELGRFGETGGTTISDSSEDFSEGGGYAADMPTESPSSVRDPSEQRGILPPVPERIVATAEAKLAEQGYSPEHMTSRADELMAYAKANPEIWEEGMRWYNREHEYSQELAARSNGNLTDDSAAAVLAAVSPRQAVAVTEDQANAIVQAVNDDGTIEVTPEMVEANYQRRAAVAQATGDEALLSAAQAQRQRELRDVGTYDVLTDDPHKVSQWHQNRSAILTDNWSKGLRIARGELPEDVLGGQKVFSFYDNIRNPDTSQSVTIDTWMVKAFTDDNITDQDLVKLLGGTPSGQKATGRYEVFSRRVREAAVRYEVTPPQAQAIIWGAIQASQAPRTAPP